MKKTLEESRFLVRRYLEENPSSDLVFLSGVDFINLLNDGAVECELNDERIGIGTGKTIYKQSVIYEGIRIEAATEYKISDSAEFGL